MFLDFYESKADLDTTWNQLADALSGQHYAAELRAMERARRACRGKQALIIVEGGEVVNGKDGQPTLEEMLAVVAPENCVLVLTRDSTQVGSTNVIRINEKLSETHSTYLFNALTDKEFSDEVRNRILSLLDGHPLAITWAGSLLAHKEEDASVLANDWESDPTRNLSDPAHREHTLEWLFKRSVAGLDSLTTSILATVGSLAPTSFSVDAILFAFDAEPAEIRDSIKTLIQRSFLRLSSQEGHREFTHVLGYQFAGKISSMDPDVQQRLGNWLAEKLAAEAKVGIESDRLLAELQHSSALLQTDENNRLWNPLGDALLYELADRFEEIGRLEWVRISITSVRNHLSRVIEQTADDTTWLREYSVSLNKLGDLAIAEGNLSEASRLYTDGLKVRQRLADSDPTNASWQRDLSVSLDRLGDLAIAEGNLSEASRLYTDGLKVRQRLADSDPTNASWQRDLSVSLEKLGDLAIAEGNLSEASRLYTDGLKVSQRLADSDPTNASWQRDLAISLEKLGDLAIDEGNLSEASRLYTDGLKVSQRLADSDPTNASWQRDLSISLEKLGDLAIAEGNLSEASRLYTDGLKVRQRLADSDPTTPVGNAISRSHLTSLAILPSTKGISARPAGSIPMVSRFASVWPIRIPPTPVGNAISRSHWKGLAILPSPKGISARPAGSIPMVSRLSQRLADSDPTNASWQRDLSVSLEKLGDLSPKGISARPAGSIPMVSRFASVWPIRIQRQLATRSLGLTGKAWRSCHRRRATRSLGLTLAESQAWRSCHRRRESQRGQQALYRWSQGEPAFGRFGSNQRQLATRSLGLTGTSLAILPSPKGISARPAGSIPMVSRFASVWPIRIQPTPVGNAISRSHTSNWGNWNRKTRMNRFPPSTRKNAIR